MLRGINSRHEQHALQYCIHVVKQCNTHCLQERTANLLSKTSLTAHDVDELESIDQKLTKILVQADQSLHHSALSLGPLPCSKPISFTDTGR